MRRVFSTLLITAALVAPVGAAKAADATGVFTSYGPVNLTCGEYLSVVSGNDRLASYAVAMWLRGYFTGLNQGTPDTKNVMGTEGAGISTAEGWILSYCIANPTAKFVDTVQSFVILAYPSRDKGRSSVLDASTPSPAAPTSPLTDYNKPLHAAAAPQSGGITLTPVDHDPFAAQVAQKGWEAFPLADAQPEKDIFGHIPQSGKK